MFIFDIHVCIDRFLSSFFFDGWITDAEAAFFFRCCLIPCHFIFTWLSVNQSFFWTNWYPRTILAREPWGGSPLACFGSLFLHLSMISRIIFWVYSWVGLLLGNQMPFVFTFCFAFLAAGSFPLLIAEEERGNVRVRCCCEFDALTMVL